MKHRSTGFIRCGRLLDRRKFLAFSGMALAAHNIKACADSGGTIIDQIETKLAQGKPVYLGKGPYYFNRELVISRPGAVIIGDSDRGTRIVSRRPLESMIQVRASNCTLRQLVLTLDHDPTMLSEKFEDRYEGEVARARSSGIYVSGASNIDISDVEISRFVNGINLAGGVRQMIDATVISEVAVKIHTKIENNIISNRESVARIYFYDGKSQQGKYCAVRLSATRDIVEISDPMPIYKGQHVKVLLFSNRDVGNRINSLKCANVDFGVLFTYQQSLTINGIVGTSIRNSQGRNDPHTVYGTGDGVHLTSNDVTGRDWETSHVDTGAAYKIRGCAKLNMCNIKSEKSGLGIDLDYCGGARITKSVFSDIGGQLDGKGAVGICVRNCPDIEVVDSKVEISEKFVDDTPGVFRRAIGILVNDRRNDSPRNISLNRIHINFADKTRRDGVGLFISGDQKSHCQVNSTLLLVTKRFTPPLEAAALVTVGRNHRIEICSDGTSALMTRRAVASKAGNIGPLCGKFEDF
jgi:hypothetical protein